MTRFGFQAMFLEEMLEMSTSGKEMIPLMETKNGGHLTQATMICLLMKVLPKCR